MPILWAFRLIKCGMEAADSGNPQAKKNVVTVHTGRQIVSDKLMNTSMWLTSDKMTTNRECVDALK